MKIKLNLDVWKNLTLGTITFNNVRFISTVFDSDTSNSVYNNIEWLMLQQTSSQKTLFYKRSNIPTTDHYYDNDVVNLSSDHTYIIFEATLNNNAKNNFKLLLDLGIIEIDFANSTTLLLYRLNDKRNVLSKTLTLVDVIDGQFKTPIGIKNFSIDVVNYPLTSTYNYIYIPKLKRYYYVNDIAFVSKDLTRINLVEDVLMSWESLIRSQSAFITRQENSYTEELFDNRIPLKDVLTVEDVTTNATDTAVGTNLTNITLDFSFPYYTSYHEDAYHILVSSFSNVRDSGNGKHPYTAPVGSGLPDLSSTHNNYQWFTFVNGNNFGLLMKAIINDDVSASYIQSILWLPFDPSTAYTLETGGVYAGDNYLTVNGTFEPLSNPETTSLPCRWATESSGKRGVCPYLIIKDFTYVASLKGINVEPYANYEFFIPFVGWIKVESNKFFNKRILIYYNLDLVSGSATAFIYSHTDKTIIWSGTCQMGVKIDTSNTNQLENTRQKQANENNMILSLLTSALSIGVGVASENPVAVVGGVLSGSKAIASYVNSNNQIFERAQTTFGSGESAMHTSKDFKIRKTYHEAITITQSVYAKLQGYPSNQYSSLSTLTGYTEIGEIHFDAKGEDIYNVEIDEIVALLKSGVIM